jgi:hypothetical protein
MISYCGSSQRTCDISYHCSACGKTYIFLPIKGVNNASKY